MTPLRPSDFVGQAIQATGMLKCASRMLISIIEQCWLNEKQGKRDSSAEPAPSKIEGVGMTKRK